MRRHLLIRHAGTEGLRRAEVRSADEAGAVAWMTDPAACPHGGESLERFAARVRAWFVSRAELDGRAVAVASVSAPVVAVRVTSLNSPALA